MMCRSARTVWLEGALIVGLSVAGSPVGARAEMEFPEPNLTLYQVGDSFLKATIQQDSALFAEKNAWLGESRANAGDHVDYWGEFGVAPGLEGKLMLGDYGSARARISGVWTTTQIGLDAAGSNSTTDIRRRQRSRTPT